MGGAGGRVGANGTIPLFVGEIIGSLEEFRGDLREIGRVWEMGKVVE